jgi:hypothetical protein
MHAETSKSQTRAREIFSKAKPEYQILIREILREEREVANMQVRTGIHNKISEHIRRIIK